MLAINGIYDGKNIYPIERIPAKNKKNKVIITFIDEVDVPNAFSFWEDERENLYQDFLPLKNHKALQR